MYTCLAKIYSYHTLLHRSYFDLFQGLILSSPVDIIQNRRIRPLLIGDGAYPSTMWQIKPYPLNINTSDAEKKFNKKLIALRFPIPQTDNCKQMSLHSWCALIRASTV